jgi:hypothetical protein
MVVGRFPDGTNSRDCLSRIVMLKHLSNLLSRNVEDSWWAIDCTTAPASIHAMGEGEVIPIGGDSEWVLKCGKDHALLETASNHGSISFNGSWETSGGPYKLKKGAEYTIVAPAGSSGIPWLIVGGEAAPAWADPGAKRNLFLNLLDDHHANGWQGPYQSLSQVRSRLDRGQVSRNALVGVEGSSLSFYLRDIWPDLIKPKVDTPEVTIEDEETTIEGSLICPFDRLTFGVGHALYFSPPDSPGRNDPPAKAASWLRREGRSVPLDKHEKVCVTKACPHCKQILPDSVGQPNSFISLVGQSGSGKSYYLAALFHDLEKVLHKLGLNWISADPALNKGIRDMSQIPFKSGPANLRMIEKTDNRAATQIEVLLRGETEKRVVPKPIIFSVTRRAEEADKLKKPGRYFTLYDNPGEHFTAVGRQNLVAEQARIAASHLAFASVIFLLYDPLLAVDFRAALGLDALAGEGDQQATMLDALPGRLKEARESEKLAAGTTQSVPMAVLVGKWDLWGSLAEGLRRDYFTPEHQLDLAVVRENSAILSDLLQRKSAPVAAAHAISDEVVYFPISSFGDVKTTTFTEKGVFITAPAEPVRPWAVTAPFVWALWKTNKDLVPVCHEE